MPSAKAYVKINLTLEVLEKLANGYHNIESVIQKISLYDIIKIESIKKGIKISCNDKDVPLDKKNTCWQIAQILQKKFKPNISGKTGVKITINKKIPIKAGLGGGSSDAAATLFELDKLWKLNLSRKQMINIATQVGKDIPFFLTPKPTSLVRGLGEKVKDLPKCRTMHIVLINPKTPVSTKWAYNTLTLEAKKYQRAAQKMIKALKDKNFNQIISNLYNDFEPSVIKRFPKIEKVKKDLIKNNAAASLMTGSGSSVYGIFKNKKEAKTTFDILKKKYKKIYLVDTI
jgi:4-diphosphocytidyl-2-C-methyl-D-erythritol kinase